MMKITHTKLEIYSDFYVIILGESNNELIIWTYIISFFQSFRYGNGYDMASGHGRKNMTRESTAPLKGWMNEHKKNPYPTKGERIMLAIISRLTMTQVSTY